MTVIDDVLLRWRPRDTLKAPGRVQVLDVFSGAGGMSLGFSAVAQAFGTFRLLGGIDIDAVSSSTYEQNFGVPGMVDDVRKIAGSRAHAATLLDRFAGYDPAAPLVLIGCAPCQGFTAHTKRRWDTQDQRNSLVAAFADLAAALSPDVVVMENVPELLSGRHWHHFEAFRNALRSAGYTVKQVIHNAAAFGTPQDRFRALVVAMRDTDFCLPKPMLPPSEYRTVRDAIGQLPPVDPGDVDPLDSMHRCAAHRRSTVDVIRAVMPDGGSRPRGIGPKSLDRVKGFYDVYGRLRWDRPSITITHYARNPASGRFVHPEQHRGLTMREAARLQGFPDSFEFKGAFDDVFRQVGEAVPPHLAVAVALSTCASLQGECADAEHDLVEEPVTNSFASRIAGLKAKASSE